MSSKIDGRRVDILSGQPGTIDDKPVKGTPIDADVALIEDSADGMIQKKITLGSFPNKHTQGTDLGLDTGGTNPITAATAKAHVDAVTGNPHSVTLEQARTAGNQLSGSIDANGQDIINLPATPPTDSSATRKDWVESLVQGLDWKESVLGYQDTPPGGTPATGARYLVEPSGTGDWAGHDDEIAVYNGASWDFIVPTDGAAVWVEDDNNLRVYNGSVWVLFGSVISHNNTTGKQGGSGSEFYHLTADGSVAAIGPGDHHGFPNLTDTNPPTFVDGTKTFTLPKTGASFNIWISGVKYNFTADQVLVGDGTDFTIAEGLWYFYFSASGVLTASQTQWNFITQTPVALLYWDATNAKAINLMDERHGWDRNLIWHLYTHRTIGTRYFSGLTLARVASGSGAADGDAQASVANGVVYDEDIEISITDGVSGRFVQELSPIANIPVYYRNGVGGLWRKKTTNAFPVKEGAARIQYNLDTAGTWSTPDATANGYRVAVWIFATNNIQEPVIAVLGQRQDLQTPGGLTSALNNNTLQGLALGTLPFAEMKILYRLIFQTSSLFANTPKCYIENIQDLRSVSNLPSGTYTATAHNSLSSRDADGAHPATAITVDSSAFDGILSTADDTVKKALDTIDAIIPDPVILIPEFPGMVISRPGSANAVQFSSGHDATAGVLRNYMRGESAQAVLQASSLMVAVKVPDGFKNWNTNAIKYQNRVDGTPGSTGLTVKVYDTTKALVHTDAKVQNGSWTETVISATDLSGGTFTPGAIMVIAFLFEAQNSKGTDLGEVTLTLAP